MDVNDVVHLILLVKQRDMTANGDVSVAGRRGRELAPEIGGNRMYSFLQFRIQPRADLEPRLQSGRQSVLLPEPNWGADLVLVGPVAGGLTVLGIELRLALAILSRCLPARLSIPGLGACS